VIILKQSLQEDSNDGCDYVFAFDDSALPNHLDRKIGPRRGFFAPESANGRMHRRALARQFNVGCSAWVRLDRIAAYECQELNVMSDGSRNPRRISPEKLMRAIRSKGLTYSEAAQQARRHLPPDSRLSHTSIWSYATGRANPKRLTYIEAIEKAMGVAPHGLGDNEMLDIKPGAEDENQSEENQEHSISLVDNGDGSTLLRVRARVPWPIAIMILEKLKGGES